VEGPVSKKVNHDWQLLLWSKFPRTDSRELFAENKDIQECFEFLASTRLYVVVRRGPTQRKTSDAGTVILQISMEQASIQRERRFFVEKSWSQIFNFGVFSTVYEYPIWITKILQGNHICISAVTLTDEAQSILLTSYAALHGDICTTAPIMLTMKCQRVMMDKAHTHICVVDPGQS
jgi:hypothetical protein